MVIHSHLCVGPSPRTKISFFLLSTCIEKLLSPPKIKTILPQSGPGSEKSDQTKIKTLIKQESKPLSGSAFLVNLTAPNKQSCRVNSGLKSSYDHLSNSLA